MNGTWDTRDLGGKPADVYLPPGGDRPRFGVLYLHDVDGRSLRGRSAFTTPFDELRLACVCPSGGLSWWVDRPATMFDPVNTPERYVVDEVFAFFSTAWRLGERSVGLLGVGMGGQAALRMAFRHPKRFPVVAAIAPTIEYHELFGRGMNVEDLYDSKEQCRQDTAPMHVHPANPPPHVRFWSDPRDVLRHRGADRLHEKLNALGAAHVFDTTEDDADAAADRAVRFLVAGLEIESRRLM